MTTKYQEWQTRIVPPRQGNIRAVAANATSQTVEIDNDVLQFTSNGVAMSLGPQLLTIQNDDLANTIYVQLASVSNAAVNSAAVSGNTIAMAIPFGQSIRVEVQPSVDKYIAVATVNGGSKTATMRYYVSSFPGITTIYGT